MSGWAWLNILETKCLISNWKKYDTNIPNFNSNCNFAVTVKWWRLEKQYTHASGHNKGYIFMNQVLDYH